MNDFTTEIVQTLVTKGDLNELFRSHLEKAINTLLRTELTAFLDYEKYDRTGFNSGNSRNGSYFRSIKTEYGELTLKYLEIVMVSLNNKLYQPTKEQTIH